MTKKRPEVRMLPRVDKRKSRIVDDLELKKMNERIKKKEKSGRKDIFDFIGEILDIPYKIRGKDFPLKKGGMMKARGGGAAIKGTKFKGIF